MPRTNASPPQEKTTGPQNDRWMERWLVLLRGTATSGGPLLELGCDRGGDTAWLLQQGFRVIATDIAMDALEACAVVAPGARLLRHDLRRPFPFVAEAFDAVVASLCLHYFDWATTVGAVNEVHRCLRPGGLLLCRVNSTNDRKHGAGSGREIEPNFFQTEARYAGCKRFFDEADLDRLFRASHWLPLSRAELSNRRYADPKVAWELVLRRR